MIKATPIIIFLLMSFFVSAQNPVADFSIPSSICIEENASITNLSSGATIYEWDFCPNDLLTQPLINNSIINSINSAKGLKILKNDNLFYGFILSSSKLYRLEFGNSLNNVPIVTDLGGLNGAINNAEDIEIVKENNYWVGFIGFGSTGNGGDIIRLKWDDLVLPPETTNIGNFGQSGRIRGLDIVQIDNLNVLVLAFYNNRLTRVDFGNSFLNNFSAGDIYTSSALSTVSFPVDVNIKKVANEWFVIFPSLISKTISIFSLGNDLFSEPTLLQSQAFDSYTFLSKSSLIRDNNNFYLLLSTLNGPLHLLDLGDLQGSPINEVPIADMPIAYAVDIVKEKSQYFAFSSVNALDRLLFSNNCGASVEYSKEIEPSISYLSSGNYPINLTAFDSNGNSSSITKEITISNNQAPDITFSTGDNLCITNPITFNSTSEANITSYNWDFGDSNTASTANPSHNYASAGTYAVKLSVTDANGCNNLYLDSVSVFEEPVPDFQATAQGSICSQKPIIFENLTTLPTEATFSWDLGDGTTSTEENPEHIYADAGDYTVIQTINMAGCTVEKTKTITVNPGPSVAFQVSNNCLGEILQFENTSQGDFLDSYQWDFGDGSQSTQENPSHLYDTAGVYDVQLSAFTTNGCDFTITQQVEIQPLATVDFLSDVACAGQPTQFTEQVTVDQSNITDYLWNFGVAGTQSDVSTEANPQFAFPSSGTYDVNLQVTTSDGCTSSGSQQITVNTAPEAAFEFDETCLDQPRLFSPLDTTNIISHFWELQNSQGEIVESSQSTNFSYLFADAGTYQLTYRQENENLCSQSNTQTLSINEQPTPDFGWSIACAGEALQLNNLTDLNGNTLKNYSWSIEEEVISTDTRPQYTFEESGEYTVTLEVETIGGCVQNISKTISVSPAPTAFFELEQNVGAYPFELSLNVDQNQVSSIEYQDSTENAKHTNPTSPLGTEGLISPLGIKGLWTLNGDTISTTSELNYIIEEAGTYLLGFLLTNDAGCTDEYYEQIKVKEPSLDVSLSNLRVNKDDEFTSFILNINNRGSLVPERIDLAIDLGSYSVTESLETPLYPEQNRNFSLSLKLTEDQLKGLSKICINASPKVGEYTDSNIQNNRICINLESGFKVMEIFPNPAVNQFTIPVITPEQDKLTISMEDSNGRQVKVFNYDLEAGYNELRIQRERLSPGIYFLRFRYQGQEKVKKIIFQ